MLNSFRCLCRSPTNCWTLLNSASRGPVVAEVSLVRFPAYLLDAWSFCRSTTRSCSNLAFSATVSSSFCKVKIRGRIIRASICEAVDKKLRTSSNRNGQRNGNLSISVLWLIYLEEYRLHLETTNRRLNRANQFHERMNRMLAILFYSRWKSMTEALILSQIRSIFEFRKNNLANNLRIIIKNNYPII